MLPFYAVLLGLRLVVTCFPALSLPLPRLPLRVQLEHRQVPGAKAMGAKYAEAGSQFIAGSEDGTPQTSAFWDGYGSHLDLTNPDTVKRRQDNAERLLPDHGIGCTWNNNKDYEIWDDGARGNGFGKQIDIGLIRRPQRKLMIRASYEVQPRTSPAKRPTLISCCGALGTQLYALTRTGDNRTG